MSLLFYMSGVLCAIASNTKAARAELMLKLGADPHIKDGWGKNALHHATEQNDLALIKLLLPYFNP